MKITTVRKADGTYDYALNGQRAGVSTLTPWGARVQGLRAAHLMTEAKPVNIEFETATCPKCDGIRWAGCGKCDAGTVTTPEGRKARKAFSDAMESALYKTALELKRGDSIAYRVGKRPARATVQGVFANGGIVGIALDNGSEFTCDADRRFWIGDRQVSERIMREIAANYPGATLR